MIERDDDADRWLSVGRRKGNAAVDLASWIICQDFSPSDIELTLGNEHYFVDWRKKRSIK